MGVAGRRRAGGGGTRPRHAGDHPQRLRGRHRHGGTAPRRWSVAVSTRFVRHPMYAGDVIMMIGLPLALGSCWGLLLVVPGLAVLVFRILDEEKLLTQELPGYREYTHTGALSVGAQRVVAARPTRLRCWCGAQSGTHARPAVATSRRPPICTGPASRHRQTPVTVTPTPRRRRSSSVTSASPPAMGQSCGSMPSGRATAADDGASAGHPERPPLRQGQSAEAAGQEVDVLGAVPDDCASRDR